jgi:ribonuclease Z
MGAYRTILNHFSQRYPKIPVLEENSSIGLSICVAFDGMRVNFADLIDLPAYLPLLQYVLEEEEEEEIVEEEEREEKEGKGTKGGKKMERKGDMEIEPVKEKQ